MEYCSGDREGGREEETGKGAERKRQGGGQRGRDREMRGIAKGRTDCARESDSNRDRGRKKGGAGAERERDAESRLHIFLSLSPSLTLPLSPSPPPSPLPLSFREQIKAPVTFLACHRVPQGCLAIHL
jgi:hypothetical protein